MSAKITLRYSSILATTGHYAWGTWGCRGTRTTFGTDRTMLEIDRKMFGIDPTMFGIDRTMFGIYRKMFGIDLACL